MYIQPPTIEEFDIVKSEHKPQLSIILPSAHIENWIKIYNSIIAATKYSFELIIVTPCFDGPLFHLFWSLSNVKIVKDFGSPVRSHCIGASLAEGTLITWIPDDGVFTAGGLDSAIDKLYEMEENKKNIITYKFTENEKVYIDEYYKINFHRGKSGEGIASDYISDDYYLLNHCVMYREYYEELGGLDCSYEGTAMALVDFSIRAQYDGAEVELLTGMPILICSQFSAGDPRHTDIEEAQHTRDEPLYEDIYKCPNWEEKKVVKLDYGSEWKKAPIAWTQKWAPIREAARKQFASIYGPESCPAAYGVLRGNWKAKISGNSQMFLDAGKGMQPLSPSQAPYRTSTQPKSREI